MRIVIADDSSTARMFTRRCLEIAGCREAVFIEAENGEEALKKLKEEPADLLVSDISMPVMDGVKLLKNIMASPKLNGLPVMVITSTLNPAREKELRDLGAFAVLEKPVSPATLSEALKPIMSDSEEE